MSFKISIVSLCAFLILGLFPNSLSAQVYDDCSNARLLFCGSNHFSSTADATVSTFPAPTCAGGSLKDVFYRFDAIPGFTYKITVLGDFYDGILMAYSGGCESPVEIACMDNEWTANAIEEIEITVPIEQTILIRTYSWNDEGNYFTINLECEAIDNDNCSDAAEIMPRYWGSANVYEGSTIGATSSSAPDPSCSSGASMNDVFYKIKTYPGFDYTISVNGDNYDGVLAAYTGNCGGTLSEIACSDFGIEVDVQESITFSVNEEQYVLIQTYDYDSSGGDFKISSMARPNNDSCVDATPLSCGDSFLGSTTDATHSGMPNPSCHSPFEPRDVFYTLDAVPGNLYQVTTEDLGNFSGRMVAYSDFNGLCNENLNEIACNTVIGYNNSLILEFTVPSAQAVLIRTYGVDLNFSLFNISLECLPLNSDCDAAIPIDLYGQSECPDNAVTYSNEGSETSVETCDDDFSPHTVFFSFNSGPHHSVNFNFNDISITDWIVQLTESCNGDVQYCDVGINSVNVTVNPNTEYILTVSTNSIFGSPGTFALCATGLNDFCVEMGGFIGETCDDGNPQTTNDVIQEDCGCQGSISSTVLGSVSWNSSCGSRSGILDVYHAGTSILADSYSVVVNADGNFTAPFNQFGDFDFILKLDGYISSGVANVTLNTPETPVFFGTQIEGDLDGNNTVNTIDFSIIVSGFGSTVGDPNYITIADYDCNTIINVIDFSIIVSSFGLAGETSPLIP